MTARFIRHENQAATRRSPTRTYPLARGGSSVRAPPFELNAKTRHRSAAQNETFGFAPKLVKQAVRSFAQKRTWTRRCRYIRLSRPIAVIALDMDDTVLPPHPRASKGQADHHTVERNDQADDQVARQGTDKDVIQDRPNIEHRSIVFPDRAG